MSYFLTGMIYVFLFFFFFFGHSIGFCSLKLLKVTCSKSVTFFFLHFFYSILKSITTLKKFKILLNKNYTTKILKQFKIKFNIYNQNHISKHHAIRCPPKIKIYSFVVYFYHKLINPQTLNCYIWPLNVWIRMKNVRVLSKLIDFVVVDKRFPNHNLVSQVFSIAKFWPFKVWIFYVFNSYNNNKRDLNMIFLVG